MAGETAIMLETARKLLWGERKFTSGFTTSGMLNCHLQTNLAQGDPQPPERMKTSREIMNRSWKTVADQLTNLLISLVCPGVPANGF
jgi:hypothetical protein